MDSTVEPSALGEHSSHSTEIERNTPSDTRADSKIQDVSRPLHNTMEPSALGEQSSRSTELHIHTLCNTRADSRPLTLSAAGDTGNHGNPLNDSPPDEQELQSSLVPVPKCLDKNSEKEEDRKGEQQQTRQPESHVFQDGGPGRETPLSADCHGVGEAGVDVNFSKSIAESPNDNKHSTSSSVHHNSSKTNQNVNTEPQKVYQAQPAYGGGYGGGGQPVYAQGGYPVYTGGPYQSGAQPVFLSPVQPNNQQQQVYVVAQIPPPPVVVKFVNPFEDEKERRKFIQKMYMVLSIDLLILFGSVAIATFVPGAAEEIDKQTPVFAALGLSLILTGCMVDCCCLEFALYKPGCWLYNAIVVSGYTILVVLGVGKFEKTTVALAAGVTMACFFLLTALAFCSKYDFSEWYMYVFVVFIVLILFSALLPFFIKRVEFKWLNFGLSCLFALIFCLMIVMETQLMCKKNVHQVFPDMYVFGATVLFIDVALLFFYMLQILGKSEN